MTGPLSHDRSYFETMYADEPDPWGFDSSWYEQRKYALTVAALPDERYRRAVEPGCANGALTERLAPRCETLHAFDLLPETAHRARRRLRDHAGVTVTCASFPEFWPAGTGDLVVWSEVAYYLTADGADMAATGLEAFLDPGGVVVAVHYTGATNYPRRGGDIVPWLDGLSFLHRLTRIEDETFELGVWRR